MRRAMIAVLILAGAMVAPSAASAAEACRTETPSGFPVPRWVSLKSNRINARIGPGEDYRALRTYRVKGLPVMVVAETQTWRRVKDVRGQVGWVISGATSGRRTVLNTSGRAIALQAKPRAGAPVNAYLAAGTLAGLERCRNGWCKITGSRVSGWAPQGSVWGAADLNCR